MYVLAVNSAPSFIEDRYIHLICCLFSWPRCYEDKSNLIEPGGTLIVIPMLTIAVIFMLFMAAPRSSMAVPIMYKKTAAGYDQQDLDYQWSYFFHNNIVIIFFRIVSISC